MDYFSLITFSIILAIILFFYFVRSLYFNRNREINDEYLLHDNETTDIESQQNTDIESQQTTSIEQNNIINSKNNGIEINNSKTSRYNYVEYKCILDEECPICLDSMLNDDIIQLKCMHKYHHKCLKEWYDKRKNSIICPECGF